jgi:hypothetical protein
MYFRKTSVTISLLTSALTAISLERSDNVFERQNLDGPG